MNLKYSNHDSKPHRTKVIDTVAGTRSQLPKRRSNRMLLKTTIGLSGEDRLKCHFMLPARATNLNRHGAVVHLCRDLEVGSVIVLRNQRGTQVSARIVSRLVATKRESTYGIEFVQNDETASNFWGITFPSNA